MAKIGKRIASDWLISAHPVNSYKARVADPALKRKRRNSKEICRMISQALNRVKADGRTVYLSSDNFQGNLRPKTLYRIELFKRYYYVLCVKQRVITLFSEDLIAGDAGRGDLIFRDEAPFGELASYYSS